MQSKPLISILTPCRNAKATLLETAQSVFNQTYPHWEWLLVDDGSQDGTIELVHELASKDPRVKLVRNPVAGSPGKSRQLALKQSMGDWCAFLDADDLWLPNKLEEQLKFNLENNFDFTFHGYRRISVDGQNVGRYLSAPKKVDLAELLSCRPIGNLTVMINKNILKGLEFPSDNNEDLRLWLKILKKGHTAYFLDKDLARYRIVPGSRGANKKRMAQDVLNLYWADNDLNVFQKFFYFSRYAISSVLKYSRF